MRLEGSLPRSFGGAPHQNLKRVSACLVGQVKSLKEASKTFPTLPEMMDVDVRNGTVRIQGSFTRNLLRVKRGLQLNRKLFEGLLADRFVPLSDLPLELRTTTSS